MTFREEKSLLGVYLGALPTGAWLMGGLALSMAGFTCLLDVEASGIATTLRQFTSLLFSVLMGAMFFSQGAAGAGPGKLSSIPHAEFLLTKPISRRKAYTLGVALCFLFMISAQLMGMGLSFLHPDLELSLSHDKTQKTEAYERLEAYREVFPESKIVKNPRSNHDTLLIPHGQRLVQGWFLWLAILLFLGLQLLPLLEVSPKFRTGMLSFFYVIVVVSLFLYAGKSEALERGFFVFARHWTLISLITLAAFLLVQRYAQKRIAESEISS